MIKIMKNYELLQSNNLSPILIHSIHDDDNNEHCKNKLNCFVNNSNIINKINRSNSLSKQSESCSNIETSKQIIINSKSNHYHYNQNVQTLATHNQITMTEYQNDLIKLVNSYESLMHNYGKLELEALAYRISAVCASYHEFCPKSLELKIKNSQLRTCMTKFIDSVNLKFLRNQTITYKIDLNKIWSHSMYLNQFAGLSATTALNQYNLISDSHTHLSNKIFLGGVPMYKNQVSYETRNNLYKALSLFGTVDLDWPKGTIISSTLRKTNQMISNQSDEQLLESDFKRGHCYAVFDDSKSVIILLSQCQRRSKGCYINFSMICPELVNAKLDSIQIIPWDRYDSFCDSLSYVNSNYSTISNGHICPSSFSVKPKIQGKSNWKSHVGNYSVFVGALHGMITAPILYKIFNDLFGFVEFTALDTDKYHYPIGSGRVTFTSPQSYLSAVRANFINVESQFFKKTIQIDPYLEDALCSKCFNAPGIYFCRNMNCFDYFCPKCWIHFHNSDLTHKPLRRTLSPKSMKNF